MSKYSEDTFNTWRMPPSNHEESKLTNAEKMIRDAISKNAELNKMTIDVYGQGSYANDTNVKLNSDIDINVRLSSPVFLQFPPGKTMQDYGYITSDYTFTTYRKTVLKALIDHFGINDVQPQDKCIRIKENNYRSAADVVPTWKFNWHIDGTATITGAKFFSDSGKEILNFSLQHVENGKFKNSRTQKRFKRLTRIFKIIKYKMAETNYHNNDHITSFLIECLLWNTPDYIFNNYSTWTQRIREVIVYLFNKTKEDKDCIGWLEVSELLYLFHESRKWTIQEVNNFLKMMWNYLEMS